MSLVRVKVPASTANLGPGFDCLGIALRIYNWISIERGSSEEPDSMVETTSAAFFHRTGERPFSFRWKITGEVPRSRGLGSSVIRSPVDRTSRIPGLGMQVRTRHTRLLMKQM